MKKRFAQVFISLMLIACMAGISPAMAAEEVAPVAESAGEGQITPHAIEYETHYRIHNGKWQYRIWNATQGFWTIPWTDCV